MKVYEASKIKISLEKAMSYVECGKLMTHTMFQEDEFFFLSKSGHIMVVSSTLVEYIDKDVFWKSRTSTKNNINNRNGDATKSIWGHGYSEIELLDIENPDRILKSIINAVRHGRGSTYIFTDVAVHDKAMSILKSTFMGGYTDAYARALDSSGFDEIHKAIHMDAINFTRLLIKSLRSLQYEDPSIKYDIGFLENVDDYLTNMNVYTSLMLFII